MENVALKNVMFELQKLQAQKFGEITTWLHVVSTKYCVGLEFSAIYKKDGEEKLASMSFSSLDQDEILNGKLEIIKKVLS